MNEIKKVKAAIASLFGIGAIMDSILEFSDAQSCPANVGQQSTNVINLGGLYAGAGVGRGTPVYLNVQVNTAFKGPQAGTIYVWLQTSPNNTTWSSGVRYASLTASVCATVGVTMVRCALPASDLEKYISTCVECGPLVSGYVDAWLSLEAPTQPLDTKTWGWTA